MNLRIEKLKEEYDKTDAKIVSLQERNKKLAEKIRQLENNDIVGAVRASGMDIDELLELLGKGNTDNDSTKTINTKHDLEEKINEV